MSEYRRLSEDLLNFINGGELNETQELFLLIYSAYPRIKDRVLNLIGKEMFETDEDKELLINELIREEPMLSKYRDMLSEILISNEGVL